MIKPGQKLKSTRLPRKTKKVLRKIFLCYTGNPEERKSKYSKEKWIVLHRQFYIWFMGTVQNNQIQKESKIANKV